MIASSISSPPTRSDWETTIPPSEMTATSVVPPPMSTIMFPVRRSTAMSRPPKPPRLSRRAIGATPSLALPRCGYYGGGARHEKSLHVDDGCVYRHHRRCTPTSLGAGAFEELAERVPDEPVEGRRQLTVRPGVVPDRLEVDLPLLRPLR